MEVIQSSSEWGRLARGQVLAIGNFDGVHVGHRALLKAAREKADQKKVGLSVMTFDPHPVAILRPEKSPGVLTPIEYKKKLISESLVDCLIIVRDNFELLNLGPEEFIDNFLMGQIRPSAIVEGPSFTFGYGRSGNIETLKSLGAKRGFEVVVVEPVQTTLTAGNDIMVSSSAVRGLLEKGLVSDGAKCLGRPYRLIGRTIEGRGKGTEIGFPTANIEALNQIIPAEGVYAGRVIIGNNEHDVCGQGQRLDAAISIGRAKTFLSDHPMLLEAHVLGRKMEPLYKKWIAMEFVESVRPQQRFENVERLKEQIAKDCDKIRAILDNT